MSVEGENVLPSSEPQLPSGPARSIGAVGTVITAAVALISLIPSAALLTDLVAIPTSLKKLVLLLLTPLSIVTIIAIVANGFAIQRWSARKSLVIFGSSAIMGTTAAVSYYVFAEDHTFRYQEEYLVSPLNPSNEIRDIIGPWANRYDQALDNSLRSDRLKELLNNQRAVPSLIMFFLMVVTQLCFIVSMVGYALRLVLRSRARETSRGKPL